MGLDPQIGKVALISGCSVAAALAVIVVGLSLPKREHRQKEKRQGSSHRTRNHWKTLDTKLQVGESVDVESEESRRLFEVLEQVGEELQQQKGRVHPDIRCNGCCEQIIYGTRYLCSECKDINICQRCEDGAIHRQSHPLYKIDYYVPRQADVRQLPREQIPWRSQHNIDALSQNNVRTDLSFERVEELRQLAGMNASPTEIQALMDQYLCIVDLTIYSPQDGTSFVVSREGFAAILPTAQYAVDSYLSNFLLDLYDVDSKGWVTFENYVQGVYFILSKDQHAKVTTIINNCPPGVSITVHLRRLLQAYTRVGDYAFRDVYNLQHFNYEFDNNNKEQTEDDDKNNDHLLWEPRREINSLASFQPFSNAPAVEAEVAKNRDLQIEQLLTRICKSGQSTSDTSRQVIGRIMANSEYTAAIVAFLEAGIP